jgi:hypothetical protein
MSTITQRKKGWWKILLVLIIAIVIIAGLGVASVLTDADGNPYFDPTPYGEGYLSIFRWASEAIFNAVFLTVLLLIGGILIAYLFYRVRGQKVTTNTTNPNNYVPSGQTISQPSQSGTETVVS